MNWLNKIKDFVGMFNLTPFEQELIKMLEKHLSPEMRTIFLDQMSLFNGVDRFLEPDERIDYGETSFYWMKWGKSQRDFFPKRFPNEEVDKAKLASMKVVTHDQNVISVTFWIVKGVFFSIEYRSPLYEYQPLEPYEIKSVEVYI